MNRKETNHKGSRALLGESLHPLRSWIHLKLPAMPMVLALALLSLVECAHAADAKSDAGGKVSPVDRTLSSAEAKSSVVEKSVVKVFSTVRYPDPYKPWTKQ